MDFGSWEGLVVVERLLSMCLTGEDDTDEFEVVETGFEDEVAVDEDVEVGFHATLSTVSLNSYRMQMDPFSPIRYETSSGSIHMVSSDGKVWWMVLVGIPTISAACAMMGSILPLILMHRYPLPLQGLSGNQWSR